MTEKNWREGIESLCYDFRNAKTEQQMINIKNKIITLAVTNVIGFIDSLKREYCQCKLIQPEGRPCRSCEILDKLKELIM